MVTFSPIVHVGCLRASARVAVLIRDFDHVRNGPPLAVSITQRTEAGRHATPG